MVDPFLEGLCAPEVLEDHLGSLLPGKRTSLVGQIEIWRQTGFHLCRSKVSNQPFVLQADLPRTTSTFAILGAIVQQTGKIPQLQVIDSRYIFQIPTMGQEALYRIVEVCTGIGALGKGAEAAGFKVQARNEIRNTFASVLRGITDQPVIEGDIGMLKTMMELWHSSDGSSTVASGFSCQPFSTGGDQKQQGDNRSKTLAYTLVYAWLSQAPLVILECVVEATSSVWVKKKLQEYCQMTNAHYTEVCMQLENFWPAKRKRWWAVLSNHRVGPVHMQPLPKVDPAPVISDVMPRFLTEPQELIEDLRLSPSEHEAFERYSKSMNSNLIDPHAVLPTALHSWGSQVLDCPCGCRPKFSHERLSSRGVFGALVLAPAIERNQACYRHIAPQEAAILCGLPMEKGWQFPTKLMLTGVGQLASPIQAAWVFGHIRQHLQQMKFDVGSTVSPQSAVARVLDDVFALRDSWFPGSTVAMQLFQEKVYQILDQKPLPTDIASRSDFGGSLSSHQNLTVQEVSEIPLVPLLDAQHCSHLIDTVRTDDHERNLLQSTGAIPGFMLNSFSFQPEPARSNSRKRDKPEGSDDFRLEPLVISSQGSPEVSEEVSPPDYPEQVSISIVHAFEQTICKLKASHGQTVADLMTAEMIINPEIAEQGIMDCLGNEVSFEEPLIDGMCIIIAGTHLMRVSDQPDQAMEQILRTVQHMPRSIGVLMQHAFVAGDEIAYYVGKVAKQYHAVFVPPLIVDDAQMLPVVSEQWMIDICNAMHTRDLSANPQGAVLSLIHAHGHWMPVMASVGSETVIRVALTLGGEALWPCMFNESSRALHKIRARPIETRFENDCGFQAVAWLAQEISGKPFEGVTMEMAKTMRLDFQHDQDPQAKPSLFVLGGAQDVAFALGTILREHGVLDERLQDRVSMILECLGTAAVQNAILSTRPWPAIKQLANQHKPRIQLIHQDEFDKIRQDRAKTAKPVGDKSLKVSKKPTRNPAQVTVSPQDIVLPHGVFKQKDGELLAQLLLKDVSPHAAGVVLGTETDLSPYLLRPTISSKGLALLVVNPSEGCIAAHGNPIRVPVACLSTQEPLIISVVIIQKGQLEVLRNRPESPMKVLEAPNAVVKILLYRDETGTEWHEIVRAPIRWLLDQFPMLQACGKDSCQCPKMHHVDHREVILDLWGRNFVSLKFQKASPESADLFVCHMRVIQQAFDRFLAQSGHAGVYLEPRSVDGKRDDSRYQTIWLQTKSNQEAKADLAMLAPGSALIRVGKRFGIRTEIDKAAEVHHKLHGESPFLSGPIRSTWEISPLPWGSTKQSIQKLLDGWCWPAKAVQAVGKSSDSSGVRWMIHATADPQCSVYSLEHGDVVITRHQPVQQRSQGPLMPIETGKRTRALLSGAQDPWQVLGQDPWASAAKMSPGEPPVSHQQLQSIEANLEAKMQKKFAEMTKADEQMTDSSLHDRVNALEAQVSQVAHQQQVQAATSSSLAGQIGQMMQQLENQSTSLEKVMEGAIDRKLGDHMTRLEALLSKRPRQE